MIVISSTCFVQTLFFCHCIVNTPGKLLSFDIASRTRLFSKTLNFLQAYNSKIRIMLFPYWGNLSTNLHGNINVKIYKIISDLIKMSMRFTRLHYSSNHCIIIWVVPNLHIIFPVYLSTLLVNGMVEHEWSCAFKQLNVLIPT